MAITKILIFPIKAPIMKLNVWLAKNVKKSMIRFKNGGELRIYTYPLMSAKMTTNAAYAKAKIIATVVKLSQNIESINPTVCNDYLNLAYLSDTIYKVNAGNEVRHPRPRTTGAPEPILL